MSIAKRLVAFCDYCRAFQVLQELNERVLVDVGVSATVGYFGAFIGYDEHGIFVFNVARLYGVQYHITWSVEVGSLYSAITMLLMIFSVNRVSSMSKTATGTMTPKLMHVHDSSLSCSSMAEPTSTET